MKLVFLVTLFLAVSFSQKGKGPTPVNPDAGESNATTTVTNSSNAGSDVPSKSNSGPPQFHGSWNLGCTEYANATFDSTITIGDSFDFVYNYYLDSNCSAPAYSISAVAAVYNFEGPSATIPGAFNVDFFWNTEGSLFDWTFYDQSTLDAVNALGCFPLLSLNVVNDLNDYSCPALLFSSALTCHVQYEVVQIIAGQLFLGDQIAVAESCSPQTRPNLAPLAYDEILESVAGKPGKPGKAGALMREAKDTDSSSVNAVSITAGIFIVISLAGVVYLVTRRKSGYIQLA